MRGVVIATILGAFLACQAAGEELRVAAAASLAEAIGDVAAEFQRASGVVVRPVLAGSNVLARQIEEGAPIDVFLSADRRTMEALEERGLVVEPEDLLGNSLVVVVARDSDAELPDPAGLVRFGRLAIGDPDGVPAGRYARAWLRGLGLWDDLEPRCVRSGDVRAALAHVASGNVDAAIVYRTDVAASRKVRVVHEVPVEASAEIRYPVALCRDSRHPAPAREFVRFLRGEVAGGLFRKRGFTVLGKRP